MKIQTITTTAILISNTVVLNPYSHSKAFHPQSFAPSFHTVDLSQSDIQILYGLLKIGNGIHQCVNIISTGIFNKKFVVHVQHIRLATLLLISIYQK